MQAKPTHYCEGQARLDPGPGFFRPDSRPARDCGVLLLRWLAGQQPAAEPLAVLDGLAGCGIRALRYGLEAHAKEIWANDADPIACLCCNAISVPWGARCSAITIQNCWPNALPLSSSLILWISMPLARRWPWCPGPLRMMRWRRRCRCTDGRSFTDRLPACGAELPRRSPAVGSWLCGCGWARSAAWALGRGIRPAEQRWAHVSTAVQGCARRHGRRAAVGLQGYCHSCGSHRGVLCCAGRAGGHRLRR